MVSLVAIRPYTPSGGQAQGLTIPASRLYDRWDRAGVEGGIPDTSAWPTVDVTAAPHNATGDGLTNDYAAIQSAMDAAENAGVPTVVHFPAGTYFWEGSRLTIPSNVVLRGVGTATSLLYYHDVNLPGAIDDEMIELRGNATFSDTALASTALIGSTTITTDSAHGLVAGDWCWLRLDTNPPTVPAPSGQSDMQGEVQKIAAVDGLTLTLEAPLKLDYGIGYSPVVRKMVPVENSGVENMKVGFTGPNYTPLDDTDETEERFMGNVLFLNAANCWVKDVEFEYGNRYGVLMQRSAHCEVNRCYMHDHIELDSSVHVNYAVSMSISVTHCLVIDNIFEDWHVAVLMQGGCSRNVVAFNFTNNVIGHGIFFHGDYANWNLIESNDCDCNITFDSFWGPHGPGNTVFRNRVRGSGTDPRAYPCSGIRTHADNSTRPTCYAANIMLNVAYHLTGLPFVSTIAAARGIGSFTGGVWQAEGMWTERNIGIARYAGGGNDNLTEIANIDGGTTAPNSWNSYEFIPSLFMPAQKAFLSGKPHPLLGADVDDASNFGARTIPAQDRFDALP